MQPDTKTRRDKSILAHVREMDALNRVTRQAPLIPLAKPYQNGWTKFFVLRDDYTRRTDAKVHLDILAKISSENFCRRRDFLDKKGREYGPSLGTIGKNEWETLGWPEHYKKYFTYGLHHVENFYGYRGVVEGYKFVRPFCFVEAIKPHFITHTRTIYPEVESRLAELRNLFDAKQYWNRYNKLKGRRRCSSDYRLMKSWYLEAIGTKEIEEYDKS